MQRWKTRAARVLTDMVVNDAPDPSVIPHLAVKTSVAPYLAPTLSRSVPEAHGYSSEKLAAMLTALENEPRACIHSILVLADGEVILDASAPGYDARMRHLCHSMAKTVTGMAVGVLWDEGLVDPETPLVDLFPEVPYRDPKFARITVEDLLTMRAGVPFAEAGVITEEKWTEVFFSETLADEPGTVFSYNSMNSYLLGRIVARKSGKTLSDFVSERIFSPLGITDFLWEKSPEGEEKGGFGLYLSAESFGKLGVLLSHGGVYGNTRVLSEEWVRRATRVHALSQSGSFDYGYHLWVSRTTDEFLFNGMLGQNVLVDPKRDLVTVITAGNSELFSESPALAVVRDAFFDIGAPLPVTRADEKRGEAILREKEASFFRARQAVVPLPCKKGIATLLHLRPRCPFPRAIEPLVGTLLLPPNNRGIMPLLLSAFQNNFPGGMSSLSFEKEGEDLFLTVTEGGIRRKMQIGLYGFADNVVDFAGEPYLVRTLASAKTVGESTVYDFVFLFPETPDTRYLRLTSAADGTYVLSMREEPDEHIAASYLDGIRSSKKATVALDLISRYTGSDPLPGLLARAFRPAFVAVPEKHPEAALLLCRAEAEERESQTKMRFLAGLFEQYLGDDETKKPSIFNLFRK